MSDTPPDAERPEHAPVPPPKRKFRTMWIILITLLVLVLGGAGVMALYVDDWSRDLSQNQAATAADHADPRLRSIVTERSIDEATNAVIEGIGTLENWGVVKFESTADRSVILATRTTGLMKFVDDITVTILKKEGRVVIDAESKSRVGKADFGQNPRNLRELTEVIEVRLGAK
ncbi:MAG: DUF1499 domain-containing protein [Pirellulaceae bacterium]